MKLIPSDVEGLHRGFADLDALLVDPRVEGAFDLEALFVLVAAMSSTMVARSVSGRPRQFCVMRGRIDDVQFCSISTFPVDSGAP